MIFSRQIEISILDSSYLTSFLLFISGFGYADFGDRQSLVDALAMNDNFLKNRKIKIDISTNSSGPDRGGQRGGFGDRMGKN